MPDATVACAWYGRRRCGSFPASASCTTSAGSFCLRAALLASDGSTRRSARAANVAVRFGPRGRFDQGFFRGADHASDC